MCCHIMRANTNADSTPTLTSSTRLPERVYFPSLNGLRIYAALSVVIAHTSHNFGELRTQPAHYALLNAITLDAQSAVNLFFVLSGFLITYLLLHEQSRTGTISVSRFYIRRILRIWPLYYLIVFLGLGVLPILLGPTYALSDFPPYKTVLILLLMPNLVGVLGPLTHLWSIGLEEQFYLVWPWVLRSTGRFIRVSLGIVIVKIAIAPVVTAFHVDSLELLFLSLRFECMAIGALGAYLYFHKHWLLRWVYSPVGQGCGLVTIVFLAVVDIPVSLLGNLITSVLFTVLILNVATNTRSWIRFENQTINALGKISYGVYMYHYLLLYIVIFTLNAVGMQEGHLYSLVLYSVTIGGTLFLAAVSYRWFESPFLQWKTWFAVIQTKR
jgi:peptidoglycan/LPS O-acetylase OafA/YrhL